MPQEKRRKRMTSQRKLKGHNLQILQDRKVKRHNLKSLQYCQVKPLVRLSGVGSDPDEEDHMNIDLIPKQPRRKPSTGITLPPMVGPST